MKKNKSTRTCQIKGCLSCKSPIYQPIINVVNNESRLILGQGHLPAIICEDCQATVKLENLLNQDDWIKLVSGILEHSPAGTRAPSYTASFLTFKKIPAYTVH